MEKNIHFADTPICQSCGMPLTAPEQFGTNADGTPDFSLDRAAKRTAITASTAAPTAKQT